MRRTSCTSIEGFATTLNGGKVGRPGRTGRRKSRPTNAGLPREDFGSSGCQEERRAASIATDLDAFRCGRLARIVATLSIAVGTLIVGFSPNRWDYVVMDLPRGHGIHPHELNRRGVHLGRHRLVLAKADTYCTVGVGSRPLGRSRCLLKNTASTAIGEQTEAKCRKINLV